MRLVFALALASFIVPLSFPETCDASHPITRTVYMYALILDDCTLDGKTLRKERHSDWGYYVTISHGIEFGSDVDSRWMRIEFQYFQKTKDVEFTVYSSRISRIGDWTKLVTFRKKIDPKEMKFDETATWPVVTFEKEKLKLKFRFFLQKAR